MRSTSTPSNTHFNKILPQLQAVFHGYDMLAEGVGIIDTEGQLVYANAMAQKILGLAEDEIKKRTYHDAQWTNLRIDGSPLPAEEHPMYITLTTGENVYDGEIGVKPPDGEVFYISINAAPIRDEDGVIIGGIGTFMDVTERRKAIRQKDEFISVASHELRTPITTLKATLQLLDRLKENPGPMLPKLVDQANRSLSKLSLLVDELLNATKLSDSQLILQASEFSIFDLIEESCSHIDMNESPSIDVRGDESLRVIADRHKIEQVVVNLVNNAVKYAPGSEIISIHIDRQNDMVRIAVTDQGPGIPAEKQRHLFDRYYRADESSKQSGFGLGLYICAQIVKQHGGEIGVDSAPGQGSTFWFIIKAAPLPDSDGY